MAAAVAARAVEGQPLRGAQPAAPAFVLSTGNDALGARISSYGASWQM